MTTLTPDVIESVDVDTFVRLLDEEPPPPCLACAEPARWAVRCHGCGFDHQYCDRHRAVVDQNPAANAYGGFRCGAPVGGRRCTHVIATPVNWRPL